MLKSKRRIGLIVTLALVVALGAVGFAYAADAVTLKAYPGVKIVYNGKTLTDGTAYIINDTTYIPLRMLMNNFGKNVSWDAANYQVIITSGLAESEKEALLINLQNRNDELEKTVKSLRDEIADLEKKADRRSDIDLRDVEDELEDYFEDAGEDYFDDDGITFTFSLSGDEDELSYNIRAYFDDADRYDDLTETRTSDLRSFLNAVRSRIISEIKGSEYEDADITGRLVDGDNSRYYVRYNGSSYTYSWD